MVLEYDYGINIGNRFGDLVDHDEDPEEYIAKQTKTEEKSKKSSKDTKTTTKASTKKSSSKTTANTTTTTTTAPATATATNTTNVNSAAKANKENQGGKSVNTDQRKQQNYFSNDNNNNQQQPRVDSGRGRGGNRGYPRRGGNAGSERPPYEGGNRGGVQQRSQRFNKFEGQQVTNEPGGFEQSGDAWANETGNDNQTYSGYRGRGGPRRGGRGRGRGGRGNFYNRNFDENSQPQPQQQQQQQSPDTSGIPKSAGPSFDNTRVQSAPTGGQEMDVDITAQDRTFEPNGARRGGRGQFRSRTFRSSRNYGNDRPGHYENEDGQDDYRQNRRQYDRRPRSYVSTVKPIEKKDGGGAHNWGKQTENPEEVPVTEETTEVAQQSAPVSKDWAKQVEEAEKQMTLDEYKKQIEEKKRAQQEKLPQFNRRAPGEGEDPKTWQKFEQEYRKKNDSAQSEEEQIDECEDEVSEDNENEEENSPDQTSGKKRIIEIPLQFKPIDTRGGPASSRGGKRRGTGRFYDRSNRDEQQTSKSANEQQSSSYQYTGEYQNDEQQQPQQRRPQQSRPYRGGSRQGFGRGEYRRSYSNSARGSRGGYNRSNADPKAIDLENTTDFPTLSNK